MKPLERIGTLKCRRLRGILTDLDGTLTDEGKLGAQGYGALWRAHDAGLRVVVVTGRPAGWVDHIARMWPVDAVVGENGAFYFHMQAGVMHRRWVEAPDDRARKARRLARLAKRIVATVPGSAVAADQFCRASDLAIDFREDVEPLDDEAVDAIVTLFRRAGATAKVSNIHVNGWLGTYDKLSCFELLASELWGERLAQTRDRYVYCGDSPNDEPMFRYFPLAVGVANVAQLASRLEHLPAFVASQPGGAGFAEIVETILSRRGR